MTTSERLPRPRTPAGFDASRAAERAADPTAWGYGPEAREAVHRVIAERRDIRRFRPDAVPPDVLRRVLEAAHRAPSVGLMQPWRFVVVRDDATRAAMRTIVQRERLRQAERFPERETQFLDQKVEGVLEAPIGICVCCDHGEPGEEILGRATIPDTDVHSTACAIQNLWLAARAEGLGVGWVSFYEPADLRALLGLPERVEPLAWLCVGWPDERPERPGLEANGWSTRLALDAVVMEERWSGTTHPRSRSVADREAAIAARDRFDALVKPGGSLGALEPLVERWAQITGAPPAARLRAGVLVCAADHGHVVHGTTLFDTEVSTQVAAAAARGETAAGVLAREGGHDLVVADLGLVGPTPPGVRRIKVAEATADITVDAAMSAAQLDAALAHGATLVSELAAVDCVVLGEIGMGNTTTTAALASALTGAPPERTVGRGTGLDSAGLERKRAVVARALARHHAEISGATARGGDERDAGARAILTSLGGFELGALAGAAIEAAHRRLPVVLDGYSTAVAALAASRIDATVADVLIAGHRSAEPGHTLVLSELGLEPLLDLRLRLGEASGALLALPLIERAGALHAWMATFAECGVDGSER